MNLIQLVLILKLMIIIIHLAMLKINNVLLKYNVQIVVIYMF